MAHNGQITRMLARHNRMDTEPDPQRRARELDRILTRMGKRLFYWLKQNPDLLPPEGWTENFRYYQSAVLGMMKEKREADKNEAKRRKNMSPAQLAELAKQELLRALPSFSPEEWALIKQAEAMYDEKKRNEQLS